MTFTQPGEREAQHYTNSKHGQSLGPQQKACCLVHVEDSDHPQQASPPAHLAQDFNINQTTGHG